MSENRLGATVEMSGNKVLAESIDFSNVSVSDDGTVSFMGTAKLAGDQGTCTDADNGNGHTMRTDTNADTDDDQERADDHGFRTHPSLRDGSETEDSDDTTLPVEIAGETYDYNDLQKAISRSEAPYPEDTSSEVLIETVRKIESEDTNESDTNDENNDVSDEYLINHGVSPEDVEDVRKFRDENGVCDGEGCEHGANKGSDTCYKFPDCDTKSQKDVKADRELSDLNDTDKKSVNLLMENENKSLEEAISMV